ncbi:MAG: FtsX-like permease family protein [Kouleothrix sp.]
MLYFAGLVAALLVSRQRGEIALLKTRGVRNVQIIGIYIIEWLLMGAIALAIGPWLGLLFAQVMGRALVPPAHQRRAGAAAGADLGQPALRRGGSGAGAGGRAAAGAGGRAPHPGRRAAAGRAYAAPAVLAALLPRYRAADHRSYGIYQLRHRRATARRGTRRRPILEPAAAAAADAVLLRAGPAGSAAHPAAAQAAGAAGPPPKLELRRWWRCARWRASPAPTAARCCC